MLAHTDEVHVLEKDRKQGWKESLVKELRPAGLASRHTTRLLDLGQEVKYFVIPACLA